MKRIKEYEKPVIEVTRFDITKNIMDEFGGDAGNGDETNLNGESEPDGGSTSAYFDF